VQLGNQKKEKPSEMEALSLLPWVEILTESIGEVDEVHQSEKVLKGSYDEALDFTLLKSYNLGLFFCVEIQVVRIRPIFSLLILLSSSHSSWNPSSNRNFSNFKTFSFFQISNEFFWS